MSIAISSDQAVPPQDSDAPLQMRLQALEIDDLLGNPVSAIGNCLSLAELYCRDGQDAPAEAMFRRAVNIAAGLGADETAGRLALLLGSMCLAREELPRGTTLLLKAVGIFGASGCDELLFLSCRALACIYRRSKRWEKAEHMLLRALEIARRRNVPVELAAGLSALGSLYLQQGNAVSARDAFHKALALYTAGAHAEGRADALGHLGVAYLLCNLPEQAHAYLYQAHQLNTNLQRPQRRADNAANLGNVYRAQKRFGKARSCYLEALPLFEAAGKHRKVALLRSLLAGLNRPDLLQSYHK